MEAEGSFRDNRTGRGIRRRDRSTFAGMTAQSCLRHQSVCCFLKGSQTLAAWAAWPSLRGSWFQSFPPLAVYTALPKDHRPWGSLSTAMLLTDARMRASCAPHTVACGVSQPGVAQAHAPNVTNQSDGTGGSLKMLGKVGKTATYSAGDREGLGGF